MWQNTVFRNGLTSRITLNLKFLSVIIYRNEGEWKTAWHSEKHSRCRDQLLTHMDWACQKDIYRLDKKLEPDPLGVFIRKSVANTVIKPWSGYVVRLDSFTLHCFSLLISFLFEFVSSEPWPDFRSTALLFNFSRSPFLCSLQV